MPATVVQNPPAQTESKSAKKKKAKAAAASGTDRTESPGPSATPEKPSSVVGNNEAGENVYIQLLKKNIRNTSKKISNATKTQSLIDENKDKTIDQLLAAKIINADQKRQVDNKPALEAELARNEEQLAQVQKIDDEWRAKFTSSQAETEKNLVEKHEQEKAEAVAEAKSKAEADAKKALEDGFLVLSQFLRLAAHRRGEAPDSDADEDMALEGVLLSVYGGDEAAVAAMVKLYEGSEEATTSVAGEPLKTTFATVKEKAAGHPSPLYPEAAPEEETLVAAESEPLGTDPTIAYASLTEIDAGTDTPLTNGHANASSATVPETEGETIIPNAEIGDDAANEAGEKQWDTPNEMAASQEWVEVQKPVETPQTEEAPAAAATQSWADDHPESSSETATPTDPATPAEPNDGFTSVQRNNRARGDRDGGFRGGRGGHHRGRGGFRGDGYRGRGRGGPRGGGRGGFRREGNEGSS